jgi:hypothetical protein
MTTPQFGQPGWSPDPADPGYKAAAAQAVGDVVQPEQSTDAAQSVQAMQDQAVRAAMSDYEAKLKAMMDAAEQQSQQFSAQFDLMQRQLATVRQQAGPPVAGLLANSLATRVQSIAIANPDLGAAHFSGVLGQAQTLAEEVGAVAAGNGDAHRVEQLANGIGAWFTRVHPKASGKFLEGAAAALDEAERIVDELPNLVPAVAAIAKAV